jgi:7,8-dihydropterin-6-yl-methyl-4-(beta-D-ribofuranosyl)aminobenzene 5'-phosphate synthase
MKITILYDNTAFQSGLKSDWGFSCHVEAQNRSILFDTGTNGSLLIDHMNKLGIDPLCIEDVFISHPHFDHVGGLSTLLNRNNNVTVYVPASFKGIKSARQVINVEEPNELNENIYTTGELEGIEQSMAVKTEKGLVLIVGCAHPEMKNILQTISRFGKVHAIIGGLHGFREFELLQDIELICPTHCTRHKGEIRSLFPGKYIEGGAGRILSDKELKIS